MVRPIGPYDRAALASLLDSGASWREAGASPPTDVVAPSDPLAGVLD